MVRILTGTLLEVGQGKRTPESVKAALEAKDRKMCIRDSFYGDDGDMTGGWIGNKAWQKMGVMAVEMEAAALYMNAARAGKHALAICTVSDHLLRNENCTAEELSLIHISDEACRRPAGRRIYPALAHRPDGPVRGNRPGLRPAPALCGARPVSYTHLRFR